MKEREEGLMRQNLVVNVRKTIPRLVVRTETSFCIYSEWFAGDVLLSADLVAGGQVQVGAGPP